MAEKTLPYVDLHETKSEAGVGEAIHLAHDVEEVKPNPFSQSMIRLYGCLAVAAHAVRAPAKPHTRNTFNQPIL